MTAQQIQEKAIATGQVALGVEFGSTTIKAVLTTNSGLTIASGSYDWTNNFFKMVSGRIAWMMFG